MRSSVPLSEDDMTALRQVARRVAYANGDDPDPINVDAMIAEARWQAAKTYDSELPLLPYLKSILKRRFTSGPRTQPSIAQLVEARSHCEKQPSLWVPYEQLAARINQRRLLRFEDEIARILEEVGHRPGIALADLKWFKAARKRTQQAVAQWLGDTVPRVVLDAREVAVRAKRLFDELPRSQGGAVKEADVERAYLRHLGEVRAEIDVVVDDGNKSGLADRCDVNHWVGSLSRRQRGAVLLRYVEDHGWPAVAVQDLLLESDHRLSWSEPVSLKVLR
jgi:hypothetical protein